MLLANHVSLITQEALGAYLASRLPLQPNEIVTLDEVIEHFGSDDSPDSRRILKRLMEMCDWPVKAYGDRGDSVYGGPNGYKRVLGYRPLDQPIIPHKGKFEDHPWHKSIAAFLEANPQIKAATTSMVIKNPVACPGPSGTHADAIVAGSVLRSLGWAKVRHHEGKRGVTVYVRPTATESVANEAHYQLRQQLADAGAVVEVFE